MNNVNHPRHSWRDDLPMEMDVNFMRVPAAVFRGEQ